MGNLTLKQKAEAIQNESNFSPEQKMAMVLKLMAEQEEKNMDAALPPNSIKGSYQRMTELPPEEKPKTVEDFKQELEQYETKKRISKYKFKPTFTDVDANTFPLCTGTKQAKIRRLLLGDFVFLGSLFPRWHRYCFADLPFDPISDQPIKLSVQEAIIIIVTRALDDWVYDEDGFGGPTDFAASVLETLIKMTASPEITVEDLLNSSVEEVVDLAVGVYKKNTDFFTKILQRSTIGNGILTTVTLLFGEMKKTVLTNLETMKDGVQKALGGNGTQPPGGEEVSSSPLPKDSKAGQKRRSKA